jgi:hypothetical protein
MNGFSAQRVRAPITILALVLVSILSGSKLADAAGNGHPVPKTLWKTYPLDPSGGKAEIRKSAPLDDNASPPRTDDNASPPRTDDTAPPAPIGQGSTAHFEPEQSPRGDRLRLIAAALVAGGLLCGLILMRRPAIRVVRNVGGALPINTIVFSATLIFVSVIVGTAVVLLIGPVLGP